MAGADIDQEEASDPRGKSPLELLIRTIVFIIYLMFFFYVMFL